MNRNGLLPLLPLILLAAVPLVVGGVYVGVTEYDNIPAPPATIAQCYAYVSEHFPGIQEGSEQFDKYVAACIAGGWINLKP